MKFDKIILLGAAILAASPLPLEAKSRKGKGDVTVAVFSLNDFHGGFVRNDYKKIPVRTGKGLCEGGNLP